jgi:hypothetical protein
MRSEKSAISQLREEGQAVAKRERYKADLAETLSSDAACRVLWHLMESCLWTKNLASKEELERQAGARSVAVMMRSDVLEVADLNLLHRMELLYAQPAEVPQEVREWMVERARELGLGGDEPSRG